MLSARFGLLAAAVTISLGLFSQGLTALADEPDLTLHVNLPGKFHAKFPGNSKPRERTELAPNGLKTFCSDVFLHGAQYEVRGGPVSKEITDGRTKKEAEEFFRFVMRGIFGKQLKDRIKVDVDLSHHGIAAFEYVHIGESNPEFYARQRFFLAGQTMYTGTVSGDKELVYGPLADRFLDSVKPLHIDPDVGTRKSTSDESSIAERWDPSADVTVLGLERHVQEEGQFEAHWPGTPKHFSKVAQGSQDPAFHSELNVDSLKYQVVALEISPVPLSRTMLDLIVEQSAQRMRGDQLKRQKAQLRKDVDIKHNGWSAIEIIGPYADKPEFMTRIRIFAADNKLFTCGVTGPENLVTSKVADAFLNSIMPIESESPAKTNTEATGESSMVEMTEPSAAAEALGLDRHVHQEGKVEAYWPKAPTHSTERPPKNEQTVFTSRLVVESVTYEVRAIQVSDKPMPKEILDKISKKVALDLREKLVKGSEDRIKRNTDLTQCGNAGVEIIGAEPDKPGVYARMRVFAAVNKLFFCGVTGPENQVTSKTADAFLDSIQPATLVESDAGAPQKATASEVADPPEGWTRFVRAEDGFEVWMPDGAKGQSADDGSYTVVGTQGTSLFVVRSANLNESDRETVKNLAPNKQATPFEYVIKSFISDAEISTVTRNGKTGLEGIGSAKEGNKRVRERIFLSDTKLYMIVTTGDGDHVISEEATQFLDSLRISNLKPNE